MQELCQKNRIFSGAQEFVKKSISNKDDVNSIAVDSSTGQCKALLKSGKELRFELSEVFNDYKLEPFNGFIEDVPVIASKRLDNGLRVCYLKGSAKPQLYSMNGVGWDYLLWHKKRPQTPKTGDAISWYGNYFCFVEELGWTTI